MKSKKQLYMEYQPEENPRLHKAWSWAKRWWLPIAIVLITSVGLVCALSIPQKVFQTPANPDDKSASVLLAQSNLRLAFLYITGGAIAVLGLIETFRRNNNEKLKNNRDHLRQILATRRERYTKAVEQLSDEKAPIRMGGVYTLVGLVDEWLGEENLSKKDRIKEGQVIINNLCAYIRSPFILATQYKELSQDAPTIDGFYKNNHHDFYSDKAKLNSEADIRLSIIKEIHERIQDSNEIWSVFEYDFSGSIFFYPIDFSYSIYKKILNFRKCIYYGHANFSNSIYHRYALFSESEYYNKVNFDKSTYRNLAVFNGSVYHSLSTFNDSTYNTLVVYSLPSSPSIYHKKSNFSNSIYYSSSIFSKSTYHLEPSFYGSIYYGEANFEESIYYGITGEYLIDYSDSIYHSLATFSKSTYYISVNFGDSLFHNGVRFDRSIYHEEVSFIGSIFQYTAIFNHVNFKNYSPLFFYRSIVDTHITLFENKNNNFTVENGRGYPIQVNQEKIPLGCKFLTLEQKINIDKKFQDIEKTLEHKENNFEHTLSRMHVELHNLRSRAIVVPFKSSHINDNTSCA